MKMADLRALIADYGKAEPISLRIRT